MPSIKVTSPNGGENWKVGSTQTIRWTSSSLNASASIEIHYWSSEWNAWVQIANKQRTATSHRWIVPSPPNYNARVRVRSVVRGIPEVVDTSNSSFKISA